MMRCRFMFVSAVGLLAALAISGILAAQKQSEQQGQYGHKHPRYKLVDIGTFGGPASYVAGDNLVTGASTRFINNRGAIADWAETSATNPYAPNCFTFANRSCVLFTKKRLLSVFYSDTNLNHWTDFAPRAPAFP